jgi:SAM-dependent methyltransferase
MNDELARWNQRFSQDGYLFGTPPNRFLASKAALLSKGQAALCIADGEGRNSVWLAEQGLDVEAFDFSPIAAEKARRLAAARGVTVRYEVTDVYGWRWPAATFDVVAAIFVQFADPPMRSFMFQRIVRALKPGGHLLMQGYGPKQLEYKTGGPPYLENLYTGDLLRGAFRSLAVVELREHEEVIHEGSAHGGMSALVDFVARKP